MAIDLKLTHAQLRLGRDLAAGTIVSQEGQILCRVIEDGKEKAELVASVAGTDNVLGYSITADSLPDVTSEVENVTVPSSGALEVDLRNNNLVTGRIRAVVVSSGQALTIDETFAGATADDAVKVSIANGIMKFHADEAGEKVDVTYLYNLTLSLAKSRFGERHINNRGLHEIFGAIELGTGLVELYTDQFDASADWASAAAVQLGDNGQLTKSGAGPALELVVVNVPNVNNPFLGVRGTLGLKTP